MREGRLRNCPKERRASEFEVNCELYIRLKSALPGFIVRGNFAFFHLGEAGGMKRVVLDVAVFDHAGSLLVSVEVKKSGKSWSERQGQLYAKVTGKPCVYARGLESAPEVMRKVAAVLGVPTAPQGGN